MKKPNYGIDAPAVIRNLLVSGLLLLACALLLPVDAFPPISAFLKQGALMPGICLTLTGLLMIAYAKAGKFRHRDRILALHSWKGDEQVLDVGTGLGLLMIGAAKKLTSGTSYGIDIFNTYDLSGNTQEQLRENAILEGVQDKVKILPENILQTSFADGSFEVVLSNLCLHNLYQEAERKQACAEIYRLLKPGGEAILSDFKHIAEYRKALEGAGLQVQRKGPYLLDTFPPLSILVAQKPVA